MSLLPAACPSRSLFGRRVRGRNGQLSLRPAGRPGRDPWVAAAETVALVLEDGSPVPETAQDIADLLHRLRGHLVQLGASLPCGNPALTKARQLSEEPTHEGCETSLVHLRRLAEATRCLLTVHPSEAAPVRAYAARREQRRTSLNTARLLAIIVGLIALSAAAFAFQARPAAASGLTLEGVAWITAITGAMACLVVLGPRRTTENTPAQEEADDEYPAMRPAGL
ncbi:MAG TPA: DUF6415 family natural product biosynthesis protein [Streptomyces sp.]|uniref:DUF6415 family natural product biosynthesis protein n=1 Tax=Streptomyces sp. TaxID=1931 RepID=UPI002CF121C5|nr:DUF6415 family natural product biosynthesis protein [Streptomyces sp.]HWU12226.1 DUF6415 family natural product biosynthesis protein [Streptomyces sp.]